VEGTVRHEGDRIRVTARLVDTSIDEPLWSHSYEGNLDELFAIQEHIAREVVESMDLRLPANLGERLSQQPATDVEAWQYLVRARHAAMRWRKDTIDEAVALLHKGLASAGEDARLYAALGRTHLHYREAGIDLGETPLLEAESNLQKAFALEPELAAGHQLNGWLHYSRGEIEPAVAALKLALESEPADPDTLSLLAYCYLISGRGAEARPLIDRLLSIDPLTPLVRCMPGWAAALEGDFDAAIAPYREMFEMDPDNPMARLFYVYILTSAGRGQDALEVAQATPPATLETPPGRVIAMFAAAIAGRAPVILMDTDKKALAQGTDLFPRFLAQAYALAGDAASAVEWISVAVDKGFINYPYLAEHDPVLAPLVGNPAYDRVLAEARRRWEAFPA
jgi:tetratricopeptide (TPR) repeat protein